MRDYLILMLISIGMARWYDFIAKGTQMRRNTWNKRVTLVFLIILMAGFAGLRTRCNDTYAYRHSYELIGSDYLDDLSLSIGDNPLFNAVNYWLKTNGVTTQNFLMFWSFITVGLYLFFTSQYSENFSMTVFLLFTTGCYSFAFAGVKQAAAVAICLVAIYLYFKGKKFWYFVFILVATLIHPYSLMYLALPILRFEPWSRRTYGLLLIAFFGGLLLQPLLGVVVNITTMMGESFTTESFSEAGVNFFRVLVCNVPTALTFIYRKQLFDGSTSEEENVIINFTMLNGMIMFVGMFGTANYFARLANYFLIFQSLSLPWILKRLSGAHRMNLTILMILGYAAYFYYANVIDQPFDQMFSRLTVKEYFKMLGG